MGYRSNIAVRICAKGNKEYDIERLLNEEGLSLLKYADVDTGDVINYDTGDYNERTIVFYGIKWYESFDDVNNFLKALEIICKEALESDDTEFEDGQAVGLQYIVIGDYVEDIIYRCYGKLVNPMTIVRKINLY